MSLLDLIKSPLKSIREALLPRIDVGGFSIVDTVLKNRQNTRRMYDDLVERAAKNKWTALVFDEQLRSLQKSRKVTTLTTHKNIGVAVRGYARSIVAVGRTGRFYNNTTLDTVTTHVCLGFLGMSWPKPYSAIPEKPPRTQRLIHRCRSFLEFRSTPPEDEGTFIQQFNAGDDELKLQLLKPKRFEAYKNGQLTINSYAQFERATLFTLEELGID